MDEQHSATVVVVWRPGAAPNPLLYSSWKIS
jgi:hypothetical protein